MTKMKSFEKWASAHVQGLGWLCIRPARWYDYPSRYPWKGEGPQKAEK